MMPRHDEMFAAICQGLDKRGVYLDAFLTTRSFLDTLHDLGMQVARQDRVIHDTERCAIYDQDSPMNYCTCMASKPPS